MSTGDQVFQLFFVVVGVFATFVFFVSYALDELKKLLENLGRFIVWFRVWRRSVWPAASAETSSVRVDNPP